MKTSLLAPSITLLLLASCSTHYALIDSVERDLTGTHSIAVKDTTNLSNTRCAAWQRTTLDEPLICDFRPDKDTLRYRYSTHLSAIEWSDLDDSLPRMMRPRVKVDRSFRWFTTRYRYTARWPQIDSLPVPISQYLTEDEQLLLFEPSALPSDWTGTDLYALLDRLNTKYVEWWSHCIFEKEYEIVYSLCDSSEQRLMEQLHDQLLSDAQRGLPDEWKSFSEVASHYDALLPLRERLLTTNDYQLLAMHWLDEACDLSTTVLWRTELPGDYAEEHIVRTDRMLTADYQLIIEHRVANWWAILLSALLLLLLVGWMARRR